MTKHDLRKSNWRDGAGRVKFPKFSGAQAHHELELPMLTSSVIKEQEAVQAPHKVILPEVSPQLRSPMRQTMVMSSDDTANGTLLHSLGILTKIRADFNTEQKQHTRAVDMEFARIKKTEQLRKKHVPRGRRLSGANASLGQLIQHEECYKVLGLGTRLHSDNRNIIAENWVNMPRVEVLHEIHENFVEHAKHTQQEVKRRARHRRQVNPTLQ